jgi:hypothetical protein
MVTIRVWPAAWNERRDLRSGRKRGRARQRTVVVALGAILAAATLVAAQTPSKSASSAPIAEINGVAITEDEVSRTIGMQLTKLEEQIYQLKLQRLESIIADRLLAAEAGRRGISLIALLDAEVTSKTAVVSEQELVLLLVTLIVNNAAPALAQTFKPVMSLIVNGSDRPVPVPVIAAPETTAICASAVGRVELPNPFVTSRSTADSSIFECTEGVTRIVVSRVAFTPALNFFGKYFHRLFDEKLRAAPRH